MSPRPLRHCTRNQPIDLRKGKSPRDCDVGQWVSKRKHDAIEDARDGHSDIDTNQDATMKDVSAAASSNEPNAYLKRQKIQREWKLNLPWAIFIVGAGVIAANVGASHGRASAESYVCPQNGTDSPEGIQCGRQIDMFVMSGEKYRRYVL